MYAYASGWVWNRYPPATRASWKPRPSRSYSAASSAHSSSTRAVGSSASCASNAGGTGSVAASTTASIAPRASMVRATSMRLRPPALHRGAPSERRPGLRPAPGRDSHLLLDPFGSSGHRFAVEVGDRREIELDPFVSRERQHDEVGEALGLFEVDHTLLEELEHREEEVALLEPGELLVEVDVVASGQEPPGLELHERRGDEQELGRGLEVESLHPLDLGAERVDDAHERDLPEIDLLLEDQVQQE